MVQFVCLLQVCVPKRRVSKHPNHPTHTMIHTEQAEETRRQIHSDGNRPWLSLICQTPHPPQASPSCDVLPFPSSGGERRCCESLSWKRGGCSCFLCKNTCLNSSKAKGKTRLSASVTALDKNSAETTPKTSTQAKQCTCAGMTPAGPPHSPLSPSVARSSSAADRRWHLTTPGYEEKMKKVSRKDTVFVLLIFVLLNALNPSRYISGFSDIGSAKKKKKKAKPKTRTLL